jgi:hypothetical protein
MIRFIMTRLVLCAAALGWAGGDPIQEWERYEKRVRDQEAPKDSLRAEFAGFYGAVKARYPGSAGVDSPWVFPLAGYGRESVGKGGFRPGIYYGGSTIKGYDFFDGNRHGGHPAYDIFIRDRDQDSREDGSGRPVEIVAPVDLIVLSRETEWQADSPLRGGKYVWTYAVSGGELVYFSHLDSVIASPGDSVPAGKVLGWVGRTGKNAAAKRSPTHLHLMALRVGKRGPEPFDYYRLLGK